MLDYRAYIVGDDGHFIDGLTYTCDNDGRRHHLGKAVVDDHDVERRAVRSKIGKENLVAKTSQHAS
jgi:hypothetical protein